MEEYRPYILFALGCSYLAYLWIIAMTYHNEPSWTIGLISLFLFAYFFPYGQIMPMVRFGIFSYHAFRRRKDQQAALILLLGSTALYYGIYFFVEPTSAYSR